MEFTAILRGLSFRPMDAKAFVNTLVGGEHLILERESTNQFDPNAIKVLSQESGIHLGYVAKEVAVEIAPLMDDGQNFICTVDSAMMKQVVLLIREPSAEDLGSSSAVVEDE